MNARASMLAGALALAAVVAGMAAESAPEGAQVELVHLANEGVLIRSGETTLVIDALFRGDYPQYPFLPEEEHQKLVEAKEPYGGIDFVLVTHHHADHFEPYSVAKHLGYNEAVRLIAPQQVIEAVVEATADLGGASIAERVHSVELEEGERQVVSLEGAPADLRIAAYRVRHAGDDEKKVQNIAWEIELGGRRLVHLGDADVASAQFRAFDFEERKVDGLLMPYWFYFSEAGLARLKEFGAAREFPIHLPKKDIEQYAERIDGEYERANTLWKQGQRVVFEDESEAED